MQLKPSCQGTVLEKKYYDHFTSFGHSLKRNVAMDCINKIMHIIYIIIVPKTHQWRCSGGRSNNVIKSKCHNLR